MPKVVKKTQPKKKATKPASKDKKKKVLTKKNKKSAAKSKNKKEKKKAVAKEAVSQSNTENLVLTVPNLHIDKAPNITASDEAFVSYFMNQYGEQAVFIAEKLPRGNKIAARVWMGDCGWEKALPVQEKCFFLSNLD